MTSLIFAALLLLGAVLWLGALLVTGFSTVAVSLGLLGMVAIIGEGGA
jgi:hypothetical protein